MSVAEGIYVQVFDKEIMVKQWADIDLSAMRGQIGDFCTEEDERIFEEDNYEELTDEYFEINKKKYSACNEADLDYLPENYDKYGNGIITWE